MIIKKIPVGATHYDGGVYKIIAGDIVVGISGEPEPQEIQPIIKTETELKAEAFDDFIKASQQDCVSIMTEQGRGWIVSASTLQAIFTVKKLLSEKWTKHD